MQIFVTGATGFIGSFLVPNLIAAGHRVVGLSRSDTGAETLGRLGADVVHGDLGDLDRLRKAAENADGVIHTAFNHDFSDLKKHSENDRNVIGMFGEALAGSDRPLVIASGTGLVDRIKADGPAKETDAHLTSDKFPRAATEEAADTLMEKGLRVMVVRLSQVHDTRRFGRLTWHVETARKHGRMAYIGKGDNRLAAVHVTDAVELFRLAAERGKAGGRYHAVAEEGVAMRDIAEVVGERLNMPVASISRDEAQDYFGWMEDLAALDMAASSALTRQELGWTPSGPGLLDDLHAMDVGV
jgi:nucleoside-diphosphate-sugar epimerase